MTSNAKSIRRNYFEPTVEDDIECRTSSRYPYSREEKSPDDHLEQRGQKRIRTLFWFAAQVLKHPPYCQGSRGGFDYSQVSGLGGI